MGAKQQKAMRTTTKGTPQTFSFSLDPLPTPDRQYVADVGCFAEDPSGNRYRFVFWQRHGDVPVSAVAVVMAPDAVRQFLATMVAMVRDQTEQVRSGSVRPERVTPLPTLPSQYVVVKANAVRAAATQYEASWDFFDAQLVARSISSNGLRIHPVLRVEMTAALSLALVEEVTKIEDSLPPPLALAPP